MITEQDLLEAIAECQGERNPNANTCIKLAAYYTIKKELYGDGQPSMEIPVYSRAAPPEDQPEQLVSYDSGSDFSKVIDGMTARNAWSVMDELMDILQATNLRLYTGVIQKLEDV